MPRIRYSTKAMFVLISACSLIAFIASHLLISQEPSWRDFDLTEIKDKLAKQQAFILFVEDTSEILWTGPSTKDFVDTNKLRSFAFDQGYLLYYLDLSKSKYSEKDLLKELPVVSSCNLPAAAVLRKGQFSLECVEAAFDEDIIDFIEGGDSP